MKLSPAGTSASEITKRTINSMGKDNGVGFSGESQIVYGDSKRGVSFTEPMTVTEARKEVKRLTGGRRVKRIIYELVPVETID